MAALDRGVRGFDADILKQSGFDSLCADQFDHTLGQTRCCDSCVRDNQHAFQAKRREVASDFRCCSRSEFVRRGAHGKNGIFHRAGNLS